MGRVYAGWGLSQAFYREQEWLKLGFSSLEDFLVGSCEANFRRRDANDLLAMLWMWQHSFAPERSSDQPQALAVAFDHRQCVRAIKIVGG